MAIPYEEFKRIIPVGSSIGKPFPNYDFVGECVSYGLTKSVKVDGVPFTAPMGHAAQIPFNATFLKYYEKVTLPVVGDLMFWGNDDGNWTGEEGHMAIFDGSGYMMNQNFNGSRIVTRDRIFLAGFIGYYRKKKGADMPKEKDVRDYFKTYVPENKGVPSAAQIKHYTTHSWRVLFDDILAVQAREYKKKLAADAILLKANTKYRTP